MDVVTLGAAKAAAKKNQAPYSPGLQPYNLIEKLKRGKSNAVMALIGDSTANGLDEWFYIVCQRLSDQYLNYRVRYTLWDDTAQTLGTGSYPAFTVVRPGVAASTITDTFNRADGAITTTETGEPWLAVANFTITGNKLTTASTAGSSADVDAGQLDYTASVDATIATSASSQQRLYVRKSGDGNNSIFAEIGTASATTFYLYKKVRGVTTTIGSANVAAITGGATVNLSVTVTGGSISATAAGTTLTGTLTKAELELMGGATRAGIWIGTSVTGAAYDNFSVVRPAPTLDCYNASVPGQICDYGTARVNALIPVTSDLVFINYGHNEQGQDCRPQYIKLARSILDRNPEAQLIAVAQNPRAATDPLYKDGLLKNSSILALAADQGWGFVDTTSRFLANPTYATDWVNPDLLHPSPAGSIVWADEVLQQLKTRPIIPAPSGARKVLATVQGMPSDFIANEGAPSLAVVSGKAVAWSFDPTTQQSIMGTMTFPAAWKFVNVYLLMLLPTPSGLNAGTNGVSWELSYTELGDAMTTMQGTQIVNSTGAVQGILGTQALTVAPVVVQGINNGANDGQYVAQVGSSLRITGRPVSLRIRRRAADAADTFASAAYVTAVVIERAN